MNPLDTTRQMHQEIEKIEKPSSKENCVNIIKEIEEALSGRDYSKVEGLTLKLNNELKGLSTGYNPMLKVHALSSSILKGISPKESEASLSREESKAIFEICNKITSSITSISSSSLEEAISAVFKQKAEWRNSCVGKQQTFKNDQVKVFFDKETDKVSLLLKTGEKIDFDTLSISRD